MPTRYHDATTTINIADAVRSSVLHKKTVFCLANGYQNIYFNSDQYKHLNYIGLMIEKNNGIVVNEAYEVVNARNYLIGKNLLFLCNYAMISRLKRSACDEYIIY